LIVDWFKVKKNSTGIDEGPRGRRFWNAPLFYVRSKVSGTIRTAKQKKRANQQPIRFTKRWQFELDSIFDAINL